jgi:hypothetical protein
MAAFLLGSLPIRDRGLRRRACDHPAMPVPRSPAAPLGRRVVLGAGLAGAGAAVALGTSGCRLRVGEPAKPPQQAQAEPTADQLALARADNRAGDLATLYAQAARLRPDLETGLRQLAADHTAHVQALQAVLGSAAPTSSSTTTSSPSATAPPSPTQLTGTNLLSVLSQAERSSTSSALGDLATVSPAGARLLASIAGCGSAHLTVLARLPARPPTAKPTGTSTKQAG